MRKEYLWVPKAERSQGPDHVGLVQLAMPMLLEHVLRTTVGLIDVAFLSRVSDSVVSAVSVASQYIILCMIFSSAVATGTIVCINQAIGMKNVKRVNRLATIAVCANILLGILFGLMFRFCSGGLLKIMSLEAASLDAAARYMRIAGGLMVFQCVEIVLNSLCRSMGHTRAPLMINLTANLINIVGNYIAVFHGAALGIDPVDGVAFATVLSRLGGMLLAALISARAGVRISLKEMVPFPKEDLKLALSIGIPGGLNNLSYSASQLVTTAIVALTGEVMVATKVYVSNLVGYIALVGMSFGQASTIMVGYRIGAGEYREAKEICALVVRIALLSNMFFSLLLILVRTPLMGLFTTDPQILALSGIIIIMDFVVEIGRALNNTVAGALQATGDVKYQLVVNQASGWIISVGLSYVLGVLLHMELYGVWIAFALDELTRGLILLRRWKSDQWMHGAEVRRKILAK